MSIISPPFERLWILDFGSWIGNVHLVMWRSGDAAMKPPSTNPHIAKSMKDRGNSQSTIHNPQLPSCRLRQGWHREREGAAVIQLRAHRDVAAVQADHFSRQGQAKSRTGD